MEFTRPLIDPDTNVTQHHRPPQIQQLWVLRCVGSQLVSSQTQVVGPKPLDYFTINYADPHHCHRPFLMNVLIYQQDDYEIYSMNLSYQFQVAMIQYSCTGFEVNFVMHATMCVKNDGMKRAQNGELVMLNSQSQAMLKAMVLLTLSTRKPAHVTIKFKVKLTRMLIVQF